MRRNAERPKRARSPFGPSRARRPRDGTPPLAFRSECCTSLEANVVLYPFPKPVNRLLTDFSHFLNLTAPKAPNTIA